MLQLATALLLSGIALLILSKALLHKALWDSLGGQIVAARSSPPLPPQAFFQSIDQDLSPWNSTGISYGQVSPSFVMPQTEFEARHTCRPEP